MEVLQCVAGVGWRSISQAPAFPLTSLTRLSTHSPSCHTNKTNLWPSSRAGRAFASSAGIGTTRDYWNVSCMTRSHLCCSAPALQYAHVTLPSSIQGLTHPPPREISFLIFGRLHREHSAMIAGEWIRRGHDLKSRWLAHPYIGNFKCQLSGFLSGMKRKCFWKMLSYFTWLPLGKLTSAVKNAN